ncbi:hypothetical protein ACFLYU_00995 [Candidatus Dependentiae bacterium]
MKKTIVTLTTLAMLALYANTFCMKKPKPSIEKAFPTGLIGTTMKKHPRVTEAESFLITINKKFEKLQHDYDKNKISYEKAKKQLDAIEKDEQKYLAIIKKYSKKAPAKGKPKKKIDPKVYKELMKKKYMQYKL